MKTDAHLPDRLQSEEELDELLTRPDPPLMAAIQRLQSPLLVLGASGKMGPSLCVLAKRAAHEAGHKLDVVAVSRFSDLRTRAWLESKGVQTASCDLLERTQLQRLPDAANLVYLVGLKFGTQQNPAQTWAVNTLVPSHVAERYPTARTVALSTGNVYPLVCLNEGGATEDCAPAPVGEYGGAALARERLFQYHSQKLGLPVALMRLNYAVELRYGVLLDIAERVWKSEPIDLSAGYLNCIWQGDANSLILRSFDLASAPPAVFNLTGLSVLSVREVAQRFGELLQRPPRFQSSESETALLSNAARLAEKLGPPATPLSRVMDWIADWVTHGGSTLGKPTHYEVRSGQY